MGEFRPGHAAVFRLRAERLRAIAGRLDAQARLLCAGVEQSYLLGEAMEFAATARRFESDAEVIERMSERSAALGDGRTVFIADVSPANDADARAGRVRLNY